MSDEPIFLRRVSRSNKGLIESVCRFCGHVSAARDAGVLTIVERAHDCPGLRDATRPDTRKHPRSHR